MKKKNYIIGNGELLAKLTPPPKIKPPSTSLYTLSEVKARLSPQLNKLTSELNTLDQALCPKDYVVTRLTLHPSFIAKGHFPSKLFREMGVYSVGSRATTVRPDKWTRKGKPEDSPTTSIFLAGRRSQINDFSKRLNDFTEESPGADDLLKIWSIDSINRKSKVMPGDLNDKGEYEVGLHLLPDHTSDFIKTSFLTYAESIGVEVHDDISISVSNLWFLPVKANRDQIDKLALHSFVRVVRPMPALRTFLPTVRSMHANIPFVMKESRPLANDIRVAILDGGLPDNHPLSSLINGYHVSDPNSKEFSGGAEHGLAVTSAFLFGPLHPSKAQRVPFSLVDHHRILDDDVNNENEFELYRTLGHIEDILLSRQYEFINISLGPNLPIDDDEVHPWTSLIDSYLADGQTFVTIAAGNNGENDSATKLNRIQVPSDCVNAIAVGSANTTNLSWERAAYSAVGPGRAPGRVKPDLLAFGGSHDEYFHVVGSSNTSPAVLPQQGTSFAAPYALRQAVGVRAIMGHDISPIAIKALLVNSAVTSDHDKSDIGWGKIPEDIESIIESPDGVARILYQGELQPGKYLKVLLPLPTDGVIGKVKIKATCCFSTSVDPQDTSMYTKAGVEISWKPKDGEKSEGFFQQVKTASEAELRRDAAKWETVLHAEKSKIGNKMDKPCFELHYMARDGGDQIPGHKAPSIKYAFVVTLEAPKHKEIFSDILQAYSEVLTEIQPRIAIQPQVNV